ncbi:hypothetical protein [Gayadomonas joobiniege]|uniref:hypothetical protein n=1 Tax=Gayadomonas joobiniege TaxID=1234606 RepID=UPI00035E67D2|nr:hypothetical protein [Gayadomonas joobiniege]
MLEIRSLDASEIECVVGGRGMGEGYHVNNGGWSEESCSNLSTFNNTMGSISFGAALYGGPIGGGVSLVFGGFGMMGMALDAQFCN